MAPDAIRPSCRLRPLVHVPGQPAHGYSLVNATNRRTSRSRGSMVSSRSPRAVCWARQPRNIASSAASSGRRCTTPETSSRCAAPPDPPAPHRLQPPNRCHPSKQGSCIQRASDSTNAGRSACRAEHRATIAAPRSAGDLPKHARLDAIPGGCSTPGWSRGAGGPSTRAERRRVRRRRRGVGRRCADTRRGRSDPCRMAGVQSPSRQHCLTSRRC